MLQLYDEASIQKIAETIRKEAISKEKMNIKEMPGYIKQLSRVTNVQIATHMPNHMIDGKWVRPAEYEDLSQIELDDDREEVYLSLYNNHDGMWHLGLYVTASKGYKVELGHIINGEFVVSNTYLMNSNVSYFEQLLPENEETMVARVTSQNSSYGITGFRFGRISQTLSGKAVTIPYYYQPVVERIGRLPNVSALNSSGTNYGYGAIYLERDAVKIGYDAIVTTLAAAWAYCCNLQQLEVENWDTSKWKVTNLQYAWQHCYNLTKLDLSNWDTTNWAVTSLNYAWQYCFNLQQLKVNSWNTTNWKVTTLNSTWQYCINLEYLDLSWNTTNWAVTAMGNFFHSCYSLKEINLSNWDTSNWKVTSIGSFQNCYSLKEINLSNWNTTNWSPTSISSIFSKCISLNSIDLSSWDTSNWNVTTISGMFGDCYSLKEVNLSNWNTSNFVLASGSTVTPFSRCYSLKKINMENWDFSKCQRLQFLNEIFKELYSLEEVNVTGWNFGNLNFSTVAGLFYLCYSLKNVDLSSWNTSNWNITAISSMFQGCYSLESIDLSSWDTSNWSMTGSMDNMFSYCCSLKEIDLSSWNGSQFHPASMKTFIDGCYNLEKANFSTLNDTSTTSPLVPQANVNLNLVDYYPPIQSHQVNMSFNTLNKLSHDSIMRIINGLPKATAARTLTLGNLRAKLTLEEIAIATQKGWTVA